MGGIKMGGGQRAGAYSESKLTNWTRYDPWHAEIASLPARLKPACVLDAEADEPIAIYERPLHAAFVRGYTAEDVAAVLRRVPAEFLRGLQGVFLMGGTTKQQRSYFSGESVLGCYSEAERTIYLFPHAREALDAIWKKAPRPHIQQEYIRAGATLTRTPQGLSIVFDAHSLRRYFLHNVLLHELGHHADRHKASDRASAERYAEWFAQHIANGLGEREA
jgi:hypothetical protein